MRVLDLLALWADHNKNTNVQMRYDEKAMPIDHFELVTELDAALLVLVPKKGGHPQRLWELTVLLNRPELRLRFVYLETPKGRRPAFGFETTKAGLIIN